MFEGELCALALLLKLALADSMPCSQSDDVHAMPCSQSDDLCAISLPCPQTEDLSKRRQALVAANAHDTILHFPKGPTCDICMRSESNKMSARRLAPDKRVESQAQKLGERIHADTVGPTRKGVGGCCSCHYRLMSTRTSSMQSPSRTRRD